IATLGAKSQADPDLAGALADEKGDHPVNSDDTQDEGQGRKGGEQARHRPRRRNRPRNDEGHRADFGDRSLTIQRGHERAKWLLEPSTRRRANHKRHGRWDGAVLERRPGAIRNVEGSLHEIGNGLPKIMTSNIRDDADNGSPVLLTHETQVFAEDLLAGPKAVRGFRADQHDCGTTGTVGL